MLLVVLSSVRLSKSTRIFVPYLSLPMYKPLGSVLPEKLNGNRFATEEAGRTRSYKLPNWLLPIGFTDRKPSFCLSVNLSTSILERVSSIAISVCNSFNFCLLLALSSMNTEQCNNASLFFRKFAISVTTSCKLPCASIVSFTSLPLDLSLFLRVAFCMIFLCSILSTSLW